MVTPGDAARASDEQESPPYPACDLYLPGHLVHFIQAEKALESGDPIRWGRFEGLEDGWLVVRYLDGTSRYRIHRPAEVARVAEVGDKVRVSERWRIASISRRFEHLVAVCIALSGDPWQPCSVAPGEPESIEDLAERLEERGGFVVPGQQVTRLAGCGSDDAAAAAAAADADADAYVGGRRPSASS